MAKQCSVGELDGASDDVAKFVDDPLAERDSGADALNLRVMLGSLLLVATFGVLAWLATTGNLAGRQYAGGNGWRGRRRALVRR